MNTRGGKEIGTPPTNEATGQREYDIGEKREIQVLMGNRGGRSAEGGGEPLQSKRTRG